ncbi:MAG: MATE family efflux transporter [Oscillospiraceae bacterium]
MKRANDLGRDKVFSLVIKLAIPSMIAQMVNVLYSIVDRIYIGNIPLIGDVALAGVGVCGPIVALLTSFGTLVGIGGSILMATKMGENDEAQAKQILSNSFYLLIFFAVTMTILFMLIKSNLLLWFGASDVTFGYANTYLTIYTLGTIFSMLAIGLNYFITCQGFSVVAMVSVISGAVSNIILDFIFIFKFEWGIAGAAWATVASQILSFVLVVSFLFGKKIHIKITHQKFSFDIVKKIISIGLSPFLILATDSIIIIIMNTVLQKHGGAEMGDLLISCATIIQSYMMLVTGPMLGITGGTQAIISYNYGARNVDRVKKAQKYIFIITISYCTIMFFVSRFLPQYFVSIFTQSDATLKLSVWGIRTFTLAVIPLSFQYVIVDSMTALGKAKIALFLSLFRKSLYVIFMVVLPMFFIPQSTFFAEPMADMIGSITSVIIFTIVFEKHLAQRAIS